MGRCSVLDVNSNSSGVRVLYVGGNYNSNDNYGLFYFNANNSASNANGNIGPRHLVQMYQAQAFCESAPDYIKSSTGNSVPLGKNTAVQDRA